MAVDKRFFIPLFERLPFGSGNFTRFNWRGWEFQDKFRSHAEMGDVFMVVTPGRNWLYVCNAEALTEIFQRRADFPRPLEIFGKYCLLQHVASYDGTSAGASIRFLESVRTTL
jgi:hypothetical protein